MPKITRNLISLGTLEEKDCEFKGSGSHIKVVKGCTIILKGYMKGNDNLYILQALAIANQAQPLYSLEPSKSWPSMILFRVFCLHLIILDC